MLNNELATSRMMLNYAQGMLADIGDDQLTMQPLPGVNHPAWIVGHLIFAGDGLVSLLGGEKTLSDQWLKLFGQGSQITSTRGDYPSKSELLAAFNERYETALGLAATATPEQLKQPNPNDRFRDNLPTVETMALLLLTVHLAVHLGQLSAWRRMIGKAHMF